MTRKWEKKILYFYEKFSIFVCRKKKKRENKMFIISQEI